MCKRRVGFIAWLMAASALVFFENNTGTRIVWLGSLLIPSLSVLCAWQAARTGKVSLTLPEACAKGTAVEGRCTISGTGMLIFASTQCMIAVSNPLTGEQARLSITPTGSREQGAAFTVKASHCGALRLSVTEAWTGDWFGLARFRLGQQPQQEMTVWPDLYPVHVELAETFARSSAQEPTMQAWRGTPVDDAFEVREYSAGDPIRRIHWKLSEKLDRTMIRGTERQEDNGILLLLETSARERLDADAIDKTVEGLLSVSHALMTSHRSHRVGWMTGGMVFKTVATEDDFAALRQQILHATSQLSDEGIGARFCGETDEALDRIALFSPSADTNAIPLVDRGRITLIVPENGKPIQGIAEIPVASVSKETAYLTF